jgi:hypothetical protein
MNGKLSFLNILRKPASQAVRSAGTSLEKFVPDAAAGSAGLIRRSWGKIPKPIRIGLPVAGLVGAASLFGGDEEIITPNVNKSLLADLSGETARTQAGNILQRGLADELADLRTAGQAGGGYTAAAQKSLNDYLANLNAYAAAQGGATQRAYQNIAAQTQADAAQAAAQGQETAAAVDRTYGATADQMAQLAAGQGTTAVGSDVAGLAGVSGEAAAAPDQARAYGMSLADYLGRQGEISRQDLAAMAQSYLAQGVGTKAQLEAQAAGLGGQAQYNLANKIAEFEAARSQQNAQQEAAIRNRYRAAQMEQELGVAERSKLGALAFAQAPTLWKSIKDDKSKRNFWAENFGVTNQNELAAILRSNPELTQLLGGL